jgi:hypothetical protein
LVDVFFLVAGVGFEPHDLRVILPFGKDTAKADIESPFAYSIFIK